MTARRPVVNVLGTLQELATADVLAITDVIHGGQGRLTLESGVPVSTTDQAAKTSVYYTPYAGVLVPIYDGARWAMFVFSEITLALDSDSGHTGYQQSGKNFDLFVVNDAGTLRLGTGPAWTSDTARGTGAGTTELERKNGLWTNKVSMTLRWGSASGNTITVAANQGTYVGTCHCGVIGQVYDTLAYRHLWNTYNRVARAMRVAEATSSWTYSTAAYRQMNNSSANQVAMVRGLDEDSVAAIVVGSATSSTATFRQVQSGVGLDSTTALTTGTLTLLATGNNVVFANQLAKYSGAPGLGYHFLAALEQGAGTDTQTFYGFGVSGIAAEVMA